MRKSLIQHLEQRGVQVRLDQHPSVHSVGLAQHSSHSSAADQPGALLRSPSESWFLYL